MAKLNARFKTGQDLADSQRRRQKSKLELKLRQAIDAANREHRSSTVMSVRPARTMMQIVGLCKEADIEYNRSSGKGMMITFPGGGVLRVRKPSSQPSTRR